MSIRGVFEEIASFENLLRAEKNVSKGKKYDLEVMSFRRDLEENLLEMRASIQRLELPPAHYSTFLVFIPKVRRVIYIDYRSKVIQRALYDVINPLVCKAFIEDTYSCIEGRGQLAAMQRLYGWFQETRHDGQKWYYYKFDVAKFFYRIDHEVMMEICRKMIGDSRTVKMIEYYVCSNRRPFGMPLDGDHLTIREEDMLWDCGIPIGGGLSHMLGNMYLHPLDQYCKRELRIKKYIRYMGDIIIMDTDKARLQWYRMKMEVFIQEKLRLEFNRKTALRPVSCGCEFVGYQIFDDHVILRKQTTLRMRRNLAGVAHRYNTRKIEFTRANETVQSYKAMLKWVNSDRFEAKLWAGFVLTHDNGKESEYECGTRPATEPMP